MSDTTQVATIEPALVGSPALARTCLKCTGELLDYPCRRCGGEGAAWEVEDCRWVNAACDPCGGGGVIYECVDCGATWLDGDFTGASDMASAARFALATDCGLRTEARR